ncbi:MAG: adenylate/guanylate cyclase domain-containing protein [Sphingopyxis sp.]|nr:adenylate/guanylate cyclase domain-containing protein [Sphingopyxis sp.]
MALKDDLENQVGAIFGAAWTTRNGQVVPAPDDLKFSNDAVKLTGTVLYADLSQSTAMVETKKPEFAAEVYKCYLHCAAKIVKSQGGVITSYDGDRIMAVYIGDKKNTRAVKTGLKINWACKNIIQPALNKPWKTDYILKHTVGIDTSDLFVARTGVRGDNDLVWVGRAANWAAKLSDLPDTHPTWITAAIHNNLDSEARIAGDGRNMWEKMTWTANNNEEIYRSNFWWSL